MKNLNAHTDMDKGICAGKCCIYVKDFSRVVSIIAKTLKTLETSRCQLDLKLINKLEMCKNLTINTLGRFTALLNIIKNDRLNYDRDVSINTLCNLANGLIEIKNIATEILDEHGVTSCSIIKKDFEELVLFINYIGLKFCVISLAILSNMTYISSEFSGKIASSLASLMFSSLLDIHNNEIKSALKDCMSTLNLTLAPTT